MANSDRAGSAAGKAVGVGEGGAAHTASKSAALSNAMTDLDELERLARAAESWGGKWYTATELTARRAMPERDSAYIAAANPQTILALIAELRAERETVATLRQILASAIDEYETTYGRKIDVKDRHWSVIGRLALTKTGDA